MDGSSGEKPRRGERSPVSERRPIVVLSSNSCWNLLNFRDALLRGLNEAGYRLIAFVPLDRHADELTRRGVDVRPVRLVRSTLNPVSNLALLGHYVALLRDLRPAAYCGFTIKPNVYGAIAARVAGVQGASAGPSHQISSLPANHTSAGCRKRPACYRPPALRAARAWRNW